MLYVYYGSDVTNVRAQAHKKVESLASGGAGVTTIMGESGTTDRIKDALGATSLFFKKEVYLLDTPSENPELSDSLIEMVGELAQSENEFVIIEGVLTTKEAKTYAEYALHAECFDRKGVKEFNVFSLTDALLLRDKKALWMLLHDAWKAGKTSEEIIGTLIWQMKMLRLCEVAKSAEEAGQKPFVYSKAKRALANFKPGEVQSLFRGLVLLYHEGHGGVRTMDRALEAWVLQL